MVALLPRMSCTVDFTLLMIPQELNPTAPNARTTTRTPEARRRPTSNRSVRVVIALPPVAASPTRPSQQPPALRIRRRGPPGADPEGSRAADLGSACSDSEWRLFGVSPRRQDFGRTTPACDPSHHQPPPR